MAPYCEFGKGREGDGAGADQVRSAAARRLSAQIVSRAAPPRDDRDGIVVQPAPAARRRADQPHSTLQVLVLLRRQQRELGMGMILVTYDLGVAPKIADTIAVIYAGRIVDRPAARARYRRDPRQPARSAASAAQKQLHAALSAVHRRVPPHPAQSVLSRTRPHGVFRRDERG
jgi:hypothetical protein